MSFILQGASGTKSCKATKYFLPNQFEDIDALNYKPSYSDALQKAENFLKHL